VNTLNFLLTNYFANINIRSVFGNLSKR
jgi:hypothetical protein